MKEKIIIIEDDENIREELKNILIRYGYDALCLEDFDNPIAFIDKEKPSLILLDVNLPMYDGYYLCRKIRKKYDTPIIIVTSRNSEADELMSMNLGADDFICKPYNIQILLARINNILKRAYKTVKEESILVYKDMTLNLSNAVIQAGSKSVELTKNEVKILSYLLKKRGTIVKRDSLMEYLWKQDYFVDDSTLNVNINRLRKKLEEIGKSGVIETRRGLGYIIS